MALVAVGGYGRAELSPRSDLDLLLLHDGGDDKAVAALADRLWYPVWDLGLALDHAVRTPARPGGRRARTQVHLGLLDARAQPTPPACCSASATALEPAGVPGPQRPRLHARRQRGRRLLRHRPDGRPPAGGGGGHGGPGAGGDARGCPRSPDAFS
ncbi:Bifunctional uridylyltransferase/uridylyl-removing enzyme [Streptomyces fumanus]